MEKAEKTAEKANGLKAFPVLIKNSISHVWLGSEYASVLCTKNLHKRI